MSFNDQIRAKYESLSLIRAEIAKHIGCNISNVSNWFNNPEQPWPSHHLENLFDLLEYNQEERKELWKEYSTEIGQQSPWEILENTTEAIDGLLAAAEISGITKRSIADIIGVSNFESITNDLIAHKYSSSICTLPIKDSCKLPLRTLIGKHPEFDLFSKKWEDIESVTSLFKKAVHHFPSIKILSKNCSTSMPSIYKFIDGSVIPSPDTFHNLIDCIDRSDIDPAIEDKAALWEMYAKISEKAYGDRKTRTVIAGKVFNKCVHKHVRNKIIPAIQAQQPEATAHIDTEIDSPNTPPH